jgi:serine/threonine protein kinase
LKESIAKNVMTQLIKGLTYIYKKNIIHRDLKLPNILIHLPNRDSGKDIPWEEVDLDKEEFIIKIADFGFARYLDDTETA